MDWYVWVWIAAGIFLDAWIASVFYKISKDKGHADSWFYFWLSFFFGPVGWLAVIALPDNELRDSLDEIARLFEQTIETGEETRPTVINFADIED